jgi:hypothetical protein
MRVQSRRRKVKRVRIFTCKNIDHPVKKTKADREDFTYTLLASISNMSYWHFI